MTVRTNEIIREVVPPKASHITELAAFHQVPRITTMDQWVLERLATRKANNGDWVVNLSVTTLIGLLVALREAQV